MFDLKKAVREWRAGLERRSSLLPWELDELEDHLRARAELESQLNPALTPARAFAAAREALGEEDAVSREFAKAGKPRWRRVLAAGWALFGLSFLLPAFFVPGAGLGLARPFGMEPYYGFEVFRNLLLGGGELGNLLAALTPNLAMVLTLMVLRGSPEARGRWLRRTLTAVGLGVMALGFMAPPIAVSANGEPTFAMHLGIGFWAWCLSIVVGAAALWIRDREWTSARLERSQSPA